MIPNVTDCFSRDAVLLTQARRVLGAFTILFYLVDRSRIFVGEHIARRMVIAQFLQHDIFVNTLNFSGRRSSRMNQCAYQALITYLLVGITVCHFATGSGFQPGARDFLG